MNPSTDLAFSFAPSRRCKAAGPARWSETTGAWGRPGARDLRPLHGWAPILTLAEGALYVGHYSLRCLEGPLWEPLPWAGRPSCLPSSPLAPSLELLTLQAPRVQAFCGPPPPLPATSAGRKCAWVGAGWRISLGSASRTGGPGHSILSSRELLLFLYPVENGNLAKWDHPAAPQLGNSDSPFRYQDAVRCAGILGPLAGLTSHRWRGPDQFLSCAQDPL